eukprot:scaffold1119_cov120-Cylindrotheca_fusiformis.AAC.1
MEHLRQNIIHDKVEPLSRDWEEKYAKLEEENEELKKLSVDKAEFSETKRLLEQRFEEAKKIREQQQDDIKHLVQYKEKMKSNIQFMSKMALLEKFGPGPHYVEIDLAFDADFPQKDETDNQTGTIIIEMAPVEEMPHVVYWFLEQVNRKLYDGCSFHRNAGHVIQGGPAPNFLSPPNPKLNKRFVDAGFHSVLFQEYSPNFQHKKYTLGFAGRPGGPDFYISTMDNSRLHGPGGQTSYEDPSEADPCFAKVVAGFDVVDRMHLSPVKPGNYKAMVNNVAIVSMKLLKEDEIVKSSKQSVSKAAKPTAENVGKPIIEKIPEDDNKSVDSKLKKDLSKKDEETAGEKKVDEDSADFKALLNEKRKKRMGRKGG